MANTHSGIRAKAASTLAGCTERAAGTANGFNGIPVGRMTSKFNLGKETEAAFFDEQGAPISESLYMSRLQQRQFELQLNNLKLGNIQFSTSGGSSSSYSRNSSRGGYQSFGYIGGGSVRDYHNSSIGSSKSSGGTGGGRSLGTPEGSGGGKPGSP